MSDTTAKASAHRADREGGNPGGGVFRLFELPPELWIRCCRLAVTVYPEPIVVEFPNDEEYTRLVPPVITRTSAAIRKETLRVFYGENEFHFVDGHYDITVFLRMWVLRGWGSYWPMVKHCVLKSPWSDVEEYLRVNTFKDDNVSVSAKRIWEDPELLHYEIKVEDPESGESQQHAE